MHLPDRRTFLSLAGVTSAGLLAGRFAKNRAAAQDTKIPRLATENHILLKTSELEVVIGNNRPGGEAHPEHRQRYNGIWSLSSVYAPDNCFVPLYAGMNLEHFMDEDFMTPKGGDKFEPRNLPMQLERLGDAAAALSHEASPLTGVSSRTEFRLREPYLIDTRFQATFHRPPRSGEWAGFFWASYLHAPEAPGLFFKDASGRWACLSADAHGRGGANSVCHTSVENPTIGDPHRIERHSLAHSYSSRRFSVPLMYGRPGDGRMMLLYMFDQAEPVRLTMSPSGGGTNEDRQTYNPAWDFQYVVPKVEPGLEVELRTRLVYKPYAGREEIEALYRAWQRELSEAN